MMGEVIPRAPSAFTFCDISAVVEAQFRRIDWNTSLSLKIGKLWRHECSYSSKNLFCSNTRGYKNIMKQFLYSLFS